MSDWSACVGRRVDAHDTLTPALIARFRATFDLGPGEAAPPGIHWCLCPPDAATAMLGEDGHPRRDAGGFLPPIALPRRMWVASDVEFVADLNTGAAIERRSTIAAVRETTGSSGALAFVDIDHDTHADGTLVVRERQTIVYREASTAPPPVLGDATAPVAAAAQTLVATPPLLLRYSALTFNAHRIHYDLPYARDVERYAGLVVHGPLNATLLLAVAHARLGRVRQFAFRGVSPAIAGERLDYLCERHGDALALRVVAQGERAVMTATAR